MLNKETVPEAYKPKIKWPKEEVDPREKLSTRTQLRKIEKTTQSEFSKELKRYRKKIKNLTPNISQD
jgi:hypothetical protein